METLELVNHQPYAKMSLGAAVKLNGVPERFASREYQTRIYAGELLTALSMRAR